MNEFIIKDSPNKGKGLFTSTPIERNSILFRFDGKLIKTDKPNELNDRFLQVGTNLYIDIEKHMGVFVNHSCNPNCYVKIAVNTAFLLSTRPIAAGDELFYDYSLTSTESLKTFSMKCGCDPFGCRRVISGFDSVPTDQQTKLISLGMVPRYVVKK